MEDGNPGNGTSLLCISPLTARPPMSYLLLVDFTPTLLFLPPLVIQGKGSGTRGWSQKYQNVLWEKQQHVIYAGSDSL